MLCCWVTTLKFFFQKFSGLKSYQTNYIIVENKSFPNLLMSILSIQSQSENQIEGCIISIGNSKIDNLLNEIKSKALKCYNISLEIIFENPPEQNYYSEFHKLLQILGPNFVQTLIKFCSSPKINLEKCLDSDDVFLKFIHFKIIKRLSHNFL